MFTFYFVSVKVQQGLELMRIPPEEGEILKTDSSPLVVEHPSFPARTSAEWLRQHGLKGNQLFFLIQLVSFLSESHKKTKTKVIVTVTEKLEKVIRSMRNQRK